MKKNILIVLIGLLSLFANAQNIKNAKVSNSYFNPIFAGDHPDPSLLVDGADYYIVHSSFEYYPGLLIWHSTDLIHWTPLENALHKYVGSVWAPDLVKYNDRYFIYFPANGTNYVVSADKIEGPWSDPVELKVSMIDPGHVVDEKGNRFLYFSSGSYVALSKDGLSIVGDVIHSYDGWQIPREWSIECFCMEGPKLFKRGQYYYLTVAEGGTAGPATGHMVISARSTSPFGPWENSPYNPIMRAQSSNEEWGSVGHGTVFEDHDGAAWMVFHGYEKEHYNMGRQTLMVPVEWTKDGWYKVPDDIKITEPIAKQGSTILKPTFTLSDQFEGNALKAHWKFFGEYDTTRFHLNKNELTINGKGKSIADCSPMLCMPADHSYRVDVEMELKGDAVGGLTLFYNPQACSGLLADSKNVITNIKGWQFVSEKNVLKGHVFLRLENVNNVINLFYSLDNKEWVKIENSLEVSGFHHNVLGGFLSLRIGLCAIGDGEVVFKNFNYEPLP